MKTQQRVKGRKCSSGSGSCGSCSTSLMHCQLRFNALAQLFQRFNKNSSEASAQLSALMPFHNCGISHVGACTCMHVCFCVGGLVVKRGCQSSCQTDSHSSLLCNSLISLLSSDAHTCRCTQHANFTHDCKHIGTQARTLNARSSAQLPLTQTQRRSSRHAVVGFSLSQSSADC